MSLTIYLAAGRQLMHDLSISGDEPWYLLQSYALIHQHTANMAAVLHNPQLYGQFMGNRPDDHTADFRGNGERVLPNLPGYAGLIVPFFVLHGRAGIVIFQAVLATATAILVFACARQVFASRIVALFATLAYVLTMPALLYVGQIFPSTVSTFATFAGLVLVARVLPHARGWRLAWAAGGVAVLASVLPWLHSKYALTGLALLALALLALRPRLRWVRRAGFDSTVWYAAAFMVGCVILSVMLIGLYSQRYFGTWLPQITALPAGRASLRHADILRARNLYVTMFLSAQSGLLPWVPLDLLVVPGLILLWRRERLLGCCVFVLFIAQLGAFLSVIFAPYVYQGWAMPARFTVDVAPLCALCVAAVFAASWPALQIAGRTLARGFTWSREPGSAAAAWELSVRVARGAGRSAQGLLAIACLVLLSAGGWFGWMAFKDPVLLYGSNAGVRLADKYPNEMPTWWFNQFVETPGIVEYSEQYRGTLPLGQWTTGQRVVRTLPVDIPSGHFDATFTLQCDTTSASTGSLAFVVEGPNRAFPNGLAQHSVSPARCATPAGILAVTVPFYSDGYDSLLFAVAESGDARITSAQVSYAPVPISGR